MENEQDKRKTPKKVWWFQEQIDVFESKLVRKLRMKENGDSLFVVYHRLRLFAAKAYGVIKVENFGDSPAEDIAFAIQEKPEYVAIVLDTLEKHGLICYSGDGTEILFPEVMERICTQADSTERTRRWREREKAKKEAQTSQSDASDVTTVTRNTCDALHNTTSHNTTSHEQENGCDGFNYERAWEYIKEIYPNLAGIEDAQMFFYDKMIKTPVNERKQAAIVIYTAVELYVMDYEQKHQNESIAYQYVPNFDNWLNKYLPQWSQKAMQKLEAEAEEERRIEAEAERQRQSEARLREWERLEQEASKAKAESQGETL